MNIIEQLDYLAKREYRIPVMQEMVLTVLRVPDEHPPKQEVIDTRRLAVAISTHLDTLDKHIEKLLRVVNKLESIGLNFPELEEYKHHHMNKYYEYAHWKPWRETDFFKER